MKSYGIEGDLLSLVECHLRDRKQSVALNGQTSDWWKINSGVPQGSILDPLLFLIYINGLPEGFISICKIFASNTSVFSKVINTINSENTLSADLKSKSD